MEHVEAVAEVMPLTVCSERDLLQELESVSAGLAASEDQWQARVEALQVRDDDDALIDQTMICMYDMYTYTPYTASTKFGCRWCREI